MSDGTVCMWMRGGTSKGAYFVREDLPADPVRRDAMLLNIMGSPHPLQIDGIGGGDPLTSKVAVVSRSERSDADIDYLFLQVSVEQALVSDAQNCGNILAGVAPFAIERGLVAAGEPITEVTIHMVNTGKLAIARVQTPDGLPYYRGDTAIDGVPGTAAPISLAFPDTAGSSCGAMLPTGRPRDIIDGVPVTLIDMGMPVVVMSAAELGISGYESREQLDADSRLQQRLESIRLQAGPLMNLGDVSGKSVPKLCMVAPARDGGSISTRTFIPHRCHASIGVLGAVSVATACMLEGGVARPLAALPDGSPMSFSVEHPSGATCVELEADDDGVVTRAALVRTARKLFDGMVYAD